MTTSGQDSNTTEAANASGPPIMAELIDADQMLVDDRSDQHALATPEPCPACGAPRDTNTKFCGSCGSPLESTAPVVPKPDGSVSSGPVSSGPVSSGRGRSRRSTRRQALSQEGDSSHTETTDAAAGGAVPDHAFSCDNCGSQVFTSADKRSYVCPFCDSSYVTEISVERSGRQRPEFIIGFGVTANQAKEKFYDWLGKNSWLRPGDLATAAIAEKQKGVYLPFWHFSMDAHSHWSAQIGEYWYRTETYTTKDSKGNTVTRTRQVRETEWFPLRGQHRSYYHGYLASATQGLTAKEAHSVQPFQLDALTRYRPFYLAGWMAEEYSIPMEPAIEQSKEEFRRREVQAVKSFLPGDTHSSLSVRTQLEVNGSDLILLPVHVLSYRYKERIFRFLVNGQTGKVIGEKPWSTRRITALVIFLVIVLAAIIAAIVFLSQ